MCGDKKSTAKCKLFQKLCPKKIVLGAIHHEETPPNYYQAHDGKGYIMVDGRVNYSAYIPVSSLAGTDADGRNAIFKATKMAMRGPQYNYKKDKSGKGDPGSGAPPPPPPPPPPADEAANEDGGDGDAEAAEDAEEAASQKSAASGNSHKSNSCCGCSCSGRHHGIYQHICCGHHK